MEESIGSRLRSYREAHGLTQEDVGARLGITKQTLHKYETGKITNIPLDKIEEMSRIYGVEPDIITGWAKEEEQNQFASKRHKVLFDRIKNANEADLEKMERILDLIEAEQERNGEV